MSNKAYGLALMIFGFVLAAGLVVFIIGSILGSPIRGFGIVAPFLGAYLGGQVYTSKHQQIIPHHLKLWTVIYYALFCIPLTFVWMVIRAAFGADWPLYSYLLGPILSAGVVLLVVSPLMYWMLGFGSRSYLKKLTR